MLRHATTVLLALTMGCAHRATPSPVAPFCAAEVHESGESQAGIAGPLHALNLRFLDAHAAARAARCRQLEQSALVLRYADGALEARLHGKVLRPATSVLPAVYHPLKDVTHALLLAALVAADGDAAHKRVQTEAALAAIEDVQRALAQPNSPTAQRITAEHLPRQRIILERAAAALRAPDVAAARAELAQARDAMEQNIAVAATGLLQGLHAAVQSVRAEVARVDPAAWRSLSVIVSVVHQARAHALEVQYFERLLHEPAVEGAAGERRMVVAENVGDAPHQYGLFALHLVDEELARVLFADPTRLQRDVLSSHTDVLDALLPAH